MPDETIFATALEKPDPAARAAYVAEACAGNPEQRKRIEALLAAHDRASRFLERPAVAAPEPGLAPTQAEAGAEAGDPPTADDVGDLGFLSPPQRADSLGRIGHYEVLEVLGRGGFGIVFRAFDDMLQRVVAVKVLSPVMAATSPARKRFTREARSAAKVKHENVVTIHDVKEEPLPYLVMEFVAGETLQQRLDRTGPLDVAETVRIVRQIAEGLAAAHEQGLVHRDIKPANILIERGSQDRMKITDFGLARAADDASLTRSGVVAGTPMYMAPEQAKGESLDCRADLFSLGSVLYVLLTGRPPFRAKTTMAVLKRVCDEDPRPIREVIPEVPQWLCRVVEKLHAKDPAGRFQTAREVADLLADCERQLQEHKKLKDFARIPEVKPGPRLSRGGWEWVAAVVAVMLMLLLLLPLTFYFSHGESKRPVQAPPPADPRLIPPPQPDPEGWVQLFNGKDLTGWRQGDWHRGEWTVEEWPAAGAAENGVLTGTAGVIRMNALYSAKAYENFHLRAEVRVGQTHGSVMFRAPFGGQLGYSATVVGKPGSHRNGELGTAFAGNKWTWFPPQGKPPQLANDWVTLEIIANGTSLETRIDGATVCRANDSTYRGGHIVLFVTAFDPSGKLDPAGNTLHFRKIEIKELFWAPEPKKPELKKPGPPLAVLEPLRDAVAARGRTVAVVKSRFEVGTASKLDLLAAQMELCEANIKLAEAEADEPDASILIPHLRELVKLREQERDLIRLRVEVGKDPADALNQANSRLADAKARLAKARPPDIAPQPREK